MQSVSFSTNFALLHELIIAMSQKNSSLKLILLNGNSDWILNIFGKKCTTIYVSWYQTFSESFYILIKNDRMFLNCVLGCIVIFNFVF